MHRYLALTVVLLSVSLATAPALRAEGTSPGPSPAAREAFEAGREAYERGRFGDALGHYQRAYDLSPTPILLFNIGRAADSDGQVERARAAYSAYLEAVPDADNREFVLARLEKIPAARDTAASATVSPALPPPVASAGPGPVRESATGSPGMSVGLRPDEVPQPLPYWKRAWFWTAIGAAVVAGATVGIVVATRAEPEPSAADLRVKTLVMR